MPDKGLMLLGPAQRERNIMWWCKTMNPEEYPMKLGHWKKVPRRLAVSHVSRPRARRALWPGVVCELACPTPRRLSHAIACHSQALHPHIYTFLNLLPLQPCELPSPSPPHTHLSQPRLLPTRPLHFPLCRRPRPRRAPAGPRPPGRRSSRPSRACPASSAPPTCPRAPSCWTPTR